MKRLNKLLCFIIVFITLVAAFCTVSFAATVGQALTSPDDGWKRYDDSYLNSFAKFTGDSWVKSGNVAGSIDETQTWTSSKSGIIEFKFYGSKLRILGVLSPNYHTNSKIEIDGVADNISQYKSAFPTERKILNYEVTDLVNKVHTVKIIEGIDKTNFGYDAVDIDENGYIIDYYSPTNLTAVPGNSKVELTWDAVDGATSYIVKRSETPGGPYTTTFPAISATYTDTTVTNGTTYYYVVTAIVNGVESGPSNEASATPTAPVVTGNPGILEITMVTGEIKEYDLTTTELQSFLSWYDGRSNGADKAYYMITKKNNIKPFLSRKEYISYDKISSFEVKEYTE